MGLRVGIRAEQALLFSAPQGKANTAPWLLIERRDRPGHLQNHHRTGAVILRARSVIPRVKVSADKDPFVRLLTPANLRDHVMDLRWPWCEVQQFELDRDWAVFERAPDELPIFHPDLCAGQWQQICAPVSRSRIQHVVSVTVGKYQPHSAGIPEEWIGLL